MPQKYLKSQIIANSIINSILNGLIAFFLFRFNENILFSDISIDVLITVGIISFLVSWITIVSARKEIANGKLSKLNYRWPKLPKAAVIRAIIITAVCIIFFGGLTVTGLICLFNPESMNNWVYIAIKTVYAGICASLATGLSILSEFAMSEL